MLQRVQRSSPFVEVMAQQSRGESVEIDSKSLSTVKTPRLAGAVFRAWAGARWIEAAASGFDPRALDGAAEGLESQLSSIAVGTSPPGPASTTVGVSDKSPARPMRDLGLERSVEFVREALGWVTSVPSIKYGQALIGWSEEERYYLNTAGANCYQRIPRVRAVVVPVATENGKSEFNVLHVGSLGGQEVLDGVTQEKALQTANEARALLAAKSPPSGSMRVVLDPGVTGTFAHESFGHGTEADQFVRERSYLQPLLGQMVGPESLTLVDDGSIPGAWGSIPFDDEGHPGQRTPLIEKGRFVGALHDRETAAVLRARPTGNTRRADFMSRAFVRMTNTLIEPSDWTLDELVEEARDGVVLEQWLSGMEDPLGGRMQLKVHQGHRIEHGKRTELVSSMALSGSVLEFLREIRGIGEATGSTIDSGYCGKGHGDYLPVGDGGVYVLSQAVVGPA